MVKRLYPFADHIVAVSQGVKRELLALSSINESKVSVIYNPVITEETFELINSSVEHPWFTPGRFVAVAVGRLARAKNYPLMLRAVSEARKHINLHLIILGDGDLKPRLMEEACSLGISEYVDFHGFVSNPLAFVAKANVFLMSSSWEGLGNVLIEAMAASTPIISTDCESGPREVLENGKWGLLVPPDDVESFANAIVKIANQGGIIPSAHSWDRFSVAKATSEYAKLIESL
jgi:glycosyltransferase involved in cell wall biosynthesis